MKEKVVTALISLLGDSHSSTVILGALLTLEELGENIPKEITLSNIKISEISIDSHMKVTINHSIINNFKCKNCGLVLNDSYASGVFARSVSLRRSWIEGKNNLKIDKASESVISEKSDISFESTSLEGNYYIQKRTKRHDLDVLKKYGDGNQPKETFCADIEEISIGKSFFSKTEKSPNR